MKHGRIDVVGVRDVRGARADLSGEVEIIAIEVKAGNQPFATAVGQARSYSTYAERCYLADLRKGKATPPFTLAEIDIASSLGVGLIAIRPSQVIKEILSSPRHSPLTHMRIEIINKLSCYQCVVCSAVYPKHSTAGSVRKAIAQRLPLCYTLDQLDDRKRSSYKYKTKYERRYVCLDCVKALLITRDA
jgi:hypothetical protein